MSIFHRSNLTVTSALLLLFSALALWCFQSTPSTPPTVAAERTLEEKVAQALEDTLGKDSFHLYLDRQTRLVVKTVDTTEVGESKVKEEQIKDEELGPRAERMGQDRGPYRHHVASRQYVVGGSETREVFTENQTIKISCVVTVKEHAWERTEIARAVLENLLGPDSKRGDKISFVRLP